MNAVKEFKRVIEERNIKTPLFEVNESIGNINLLKDGETVYSTYFLQKNEILEVIIEFKLI
ncbi:hypothetical protein [Methanobrevibacter sp. DSM 116169]|uniref:hypothetical protein n=1 Tax=Methanobrevibacter sp. DSM 116169 TaxID=3242727 RepID=UPI0038FC30D6